MSNGETVIQFVELSRTQRKFGVSVEYNDMAVAEFMGGVVHVRTQPQQGNPAGRTYIEVPTPVGLEQANVGDWIIKTTDGHLRVRKCETIS